MKIKYPLARPSINANDIAGVVGVMKSEVLALGPKLKEFEAAFAKKIGVKYACAVNSGTSGLHLAMIAAGIGPGDEVITTPFSFVASANCILYVGATPVFVDVEPTTYGMDPKKIEEKITPRTKALVVVHVFGQSCDMDPILRIAKKHKLKIIEDACESIGASYKGRGVGTFGESAVFAFYPNKQMTTGEGGMIVTNSSKVYGLCKSLANQGRGANMSWLDHQYLGYNYRLDELSAALGVSQLKRLTSLISARRAVASIYSRELRPFKDRIQAPQVASYSTHTWFVYVVTLKPHKKNAGPALRDKVIAELEKKGIAAKPYFPSIHLFSFYRNKFNFKQGDFPVSEGISNYSLALPFYSTLSKSDINYIVTILANILEKYD